MCDTRSHDRPWHCVSKHLYDKPVLLELSLNSVYLFTPIPRLFLVQDKLQNYLDSESNEQQHQTRCCPKMITATHKANVVLKTKMLNTENKASLCDVLLVSGQDLHYRKGKLLPMYCF